MSTTTLPVIRLQSCPKGYTRDLDKTISPQETYERVQARMQAAGLDILAEVRRVDVGRLGIPVYLSVCGRDARGIMPTRKQMGKGSSPEQARASALMELMERFAFFSFWQRLPHMVSATWAEAEERFGKDLLPIEEICRSVDDSLSPEQAREAMSTLRWNFFPATHLADGRTSGCRWTGSSCWANSTARPPATARRNRFCRAFPNWWSGMSAAVSTGNA